MDTNGTVISMYEATEAHLGYPPFTRNPPVPAHRKNQYTH